MAKGKNLNPADAQRKADRKKELKKNKTERQKSRDFALVKKDTTGLEEDIERLEKAESDGVISASQKTQLSSLRAELVRINKKKDAYVAEHPEHRKLVYRSRHKNSEQEVDKEEDKKKDRKVFDKNGLPRHPERSVYYDPVMNPYGVPPPGMPYMERPLLPDEVDSQAEEESDEAEAGSDDEIPMPSGPPPPKEAQSKHENEVEVASDDDIPMPEGPPPSKLPPLPPPLPMPPLPTILHHPQTHLPSKFIPPPPLPPGFPAVQPMGFSSFAPMLPPPGFPIPPPPPGFPSAGSTFFPSSARPQSNGSVQDPLASVPHQTFQAYRAQQMSHPLPNKPTQDVMGSQVASSSDATQPPQSTGAGTISAPAQLRDLKKESTAFVPSSLKRKRNTVKMNSSSGASAGRINAAPEANVTGKDIESGDVEAARPDLLGALKSNFPAPFDAAAKKRKADLPETLKGKDDYEKFMEEVGDILGT